MILQPSVMILVVLLCVTGLVCGQSKTQEPAELIIRMDDMGFCHGANMAFKRVLEEGTATSVSLMVNSPWLGEAVEILEQHPEVSVGVHLTLNANGGNIVSDQ